MRGTHPPGGDRAGGRPPLGIGEACRGDDTDSAIPHPAGRAPVPTACTTDPRLRRDLDTLASLGGRVVGAALDDAASLGADGVAPTEAAAMVAREYAERAGMIRAAGGDRWPAGGFSLVPDDFGAVSRHIARVPCLPWWWAR